MRLILFIICYMCCSHSAVNCMVDKIDVKRQNDLLEYAWKVDLSHVVSNYTENNRIKSNELENDLSNKYETNITIKTLIDFYYMIGSRISCKGFKYNNIKYLRIAESSLKLSLEYCAKVKSYDAETIANKKLASEQLKEVQLYILGLSGDTSHRTCCYPQ